MSSPEKQKNKILIVEDEKDTRFLFERLLTKNNFGVSSSENGAEAINLLKEYSPDVILADWTMPVMNGLELCRVLKNDEKYKTIYFIILTARASLKDRVTGLDVGADDFLVKPVDNQELLARIRTGIRITNLQRELQKIEHGKAVIEMACTIGHKINNPLSSLLFSLKNIEEELLKEKNTRYNDDLKTINESIERIKKLVHDLTHLQVPDMIDYASNQKMIKFD